MIRGFKKFLMTVPASSRERGAGLAIVMIAAGVIGAITVATTSMVNNQTKERVMSQQRDSRMFAYEYVKSNAADPDTLRVSAKSNSALRACIYNTLPNSCKGGTSVAGKPPSMRPFRMVIPFSRQVPAVGISGLSINDKNGHFTNRGLRANCKPGPNCPFYVRTWFWAQCPNNAATCNQASRIFVRTQVGQHPRARIKNGLKMSEYPRNKVFASDPYFDSDFTMVSDITSSIYQQCPTGSYMAGTKEYKLPGAPKNAPPMALPQCECSQGYEQTGIDSATGWPKCKPMKTCDTGSGEILAGINPDGSANCYNPPASDYTCEDFKTPSNGKVSCKAGWRMRKVQTKSECEIRKEPGQGDVVFCDTMDITCCKKK